MRAKALPAISASTMGSEDGWEEVQTGRKSIRSRPDAREKSDRKNEKSKQMTNTEREPRSGRGRGREASKVTEKRSPRDNSESKTEEKLASKHTASQKPLVKQPTVVVAAALAPAVPEISAELQHIAESFEAITLQDGSTGDSLPAPPPKPKAWSLGNRPSIHAEPSLTLPDSDSLEHTVVLKQLYTSNVDFQSVCQTYFNSTESIISKHPAVIRGLINNGCACFRNCILQAIMAIPSFAGLLDYVLDRVDLDCDLATSPSWREILAFRQAFVSSLSSGTASSSSRSALAADLYLHDLLASFQALVGPTSTAPEPTLATTTTRRQRQANAHTPRGSQQDAMEFLTHLLDHLHEQSLWVDVPLSSTATASDHHEKSTLLAIDDDEEYAVESEDESEATGWQTVRRNVPKDLRGYRVTVDSESLERHVLRSPPSPIATLFHGCLRSEVIYRSRRVCSVTFQRFHSLTLHLPASMPGSSSSGASLHLVDLLRNQFQREVLDEGETQKIVQLERLPAVLTLQIARFSFDFIHLQPVKVACPVIYPPTLDLSEHLCFLSPRLAQSVAKGREGKAVYRLQAVVLHHGKKATGGHYSTYLAHHSERGDAIWHHLNDSKCAPLTESQALAAESLVYLLFYTRDPQQSSSSTS